MNRNDRPQQRERLGFLLTVALLWLCLFSLYQAIGLMEGILLLIAAFRGELPLFAGIGVLFAAAAFLVLGILPIIFLIKGNRAFFVFLALCQLLNLFASILSVTLGNKIILFIGCLVLYAIFWTLLFVSDRVRRRFGLPLLCAKKKITRP